MIRDSQEMNIDTNFSGSLRVSPYNTVGIGAGAVLPAWPIAFHRRHG